MPDLNFVAQFPIVNESLPLSMLHAEAKTETTHMVHELGFGTAGPFHIQLLDMPLATYLECVVAVKPLKFPGDK